MTNLGNFTFKKGEMIVKSSVFSKTGFAAEFGLDLGKKGIIVPDARWEEIVAVLLNAGYTLN